MAVEEIGEAGHGKDHTGDAPEVDGNVCVSSEEPLYPGQFYDVLVEDSDLYDLYGTVAK